MLIRTLRRPSYRIIGTNLWTAHGEIHGVNLEIDHGRLVAIKTYKCEEPGPNDIDGRGLVVMPAGVDAQVHLRVPGQPHKETPLSGLSAAVHGGVGALLTMPNTKPVIDSVDSVDAAFDELSGAVEATGVRVLLSAAMTKGQKGQEVVDFPKLAGRGVAAFTDDGVGVARDDIMEVCMRWSGRLQLPLLQHAEVPGHGAVLAESAVQSKIGSSPYPETAETEMVRRDLALLRLNRSSRYHVLHVSSAKTIDLVQAAKQEGLPVSCEVSPHHLFFSADDIRDRNTSFKMNPPLRTEDDRQLLRSGLCSGAIDFMATDHAPHEPEVKTDNFKTSAFGTVGLETSLRVLISMWQAGELNATRLVHVWSTRPAEFLNLQNDFGDIRLGRMFNAVLTDVYAPPALVTAEYHVGKSKNSCFNDAMLPGRITATLLGEYVHLM